VWDLARTKKPLCGVWCVVRGVCMVHGAFMRCVMSVWRYEAGGLGVLSYSLGSWVLGNHLVLGLVELESREPAGN